MKIALAQQNYHIGNFEANTRKIIAGIHQAKAAGADLVVFTELSVCGYPPRDFLEFDDFITQSYEAIDRIRQEADTIGVIVGAPARNPAREGKDLFNAAWLLYEKEIKGVAHKTCLPNYDVFDEYRYFEPAFEWKVIPFKGKKIALTICEDVWNLGDNPLYRVCPMDHLIRQHPDVMINISASPFNYDRDEDRKEVVRQNVLKYHLPMYYCNAVGSQTEIVFDGSSLVYDAKGNLIHELRSFEEDFAVVSLPHRVPPLYEELLPGLSVRTGSEDDTTSHSGAATPGAAIAPAVFDKDLQVSKQYDPQRVLEYLTDDRNISQIRKALLMGIRDYFSKMGFGKAIIASSGGIDSAVTLALACEALGKDNVRAILLPSAYSTSHSVSDAEQLSRNLGNPYDIIPIREVYDALIHTLAPVFKDTPFGLAEENLQSRTRGNLVMGLANKFGYIMLNTSNKSELATGYGTLYGDMAGGLSVLGDVYKGQVYALAHDINRDGEIIPVNILHKAPSAELRPGQKDSDSLPDYDTLDKVLYQYIERRQGPAAIAAMGIDKAVVSRILRLVNTSEYKRNQFCPIIRVSCKAFGVGRRVPIVGKYLS
ncbi:NAD+ synthase [Puia dinghuensis]|uniref:Glutamine-dependent NAD(+) synthetase n=1 Tax=Puia dinghuensis TaxID=1792502 RepID=A0A8J2UGG2_9BACT|nr:NAD+ synthase [Puia dinghuensis]GGB13982.1 NAD+ synthase [Puia dinghuensis]